MNKVFFTSDMHFGHENILRLDNRPFENLEEMERELIERWNRKVGKDDLVYSMGDMFWKNVTNEIPRIMKELNGKKILVVGNHDHYLKNKSFWSYFEDVQNYIETDVRLEDGTLKRCILSHYFIPFYNGYRRGYIHLHGHSHLSEEADEERKTVEKYNAQGRTLTVYNVGCMYWDYEPVTLDEMLVWKNELRLEKNSVVEE